jgi:hypothetical protein
MLRFGVEFTPQDGAVFMYLRYFRGHADLYPQMSRKAAEITVDISGVKAEADLGRA